MLTVDLNKEVSSEKRDKFYAYLGEKQWTKINQLTTLWYTKWQDGLLEQQMIQTTKSDIEGAAAVSGVSHYDVALANCLKPIVWTK